MTDHHAFTTKPRHAVRWFVAVTLGVVVLLVAAWWLGLANPRLHAAGGSLSVEPDGTAAAVLHLDNDGRLPVTILEATPIGDEVSRASLAAPVHVPGTAGAAVSLELAMACQSGEGAPSGVRLRVRTWLGTHRDVDVTDLLFDRCP